MYVENGSQLLLLELKKNIGDKMAKTTKKEKDSKQFVLGSDIIKALGVETIKPLIDNDSDVINRIIVPMNWFSERDRNDDNVRNFLMHVQKGARQDNVFLLDENIEVQLPENLESVENLKGLTCDPFIHFEMMQKGITDIKEPNFASRDSRIMENGFINKDSNSKSKDLKRTISLPEAIKEFSLEMDPLKSINFS